jgi:hypothetical protein
MLVGIAEKISISSSDSLSPKSLLLKTSDLMVAGSAEKMATSPATDRS